MITDPPGVKPEPVTTIPVPTLASVGFSVNERVVMIGVVVGSAELLVGVGSGAVVPGISVATAVGAGDDVEGGGVVSLLLMRVKLAVANPSV